MIDEYQDPYNQPYRSATAPSSWLPDGATINSDGSITLANGSVMPAPPPGYERDPNTGVISYVSTPGTTPISGLDPNDPNKPNAAWTAQAPTPTDPGAGTVSQPSSGGGYTAPTSSGGPLPGPAPIPTTTAAPPTGTSYTPPPAYQPPPAFSYKDFTAPTGQDVLNDPGYGFELNQGIQAIGAKNAALGTLNTGGTIKDFMGFGQNLASTKYNDVFNRKLTEYNTDRGNALDTYNTNYGTQYKDPYAINYASQYSDPFAMNLQGAQLSQNNNQFNASLGQNNSQFNSNLDWQKFLQNYKATTTDPFNQKYQLLGLL